MTDGFVLKLATKNTYDGWLEFDNGIKLKIDYPTLPQKDKLNSLLLKGLDINAKKFETKETTNQEFMRMYIKFTVKDWEGMKDGNGNVYKCETVKDEFGGTELKEDLWFMLCDDIIQTRVIFNRIAIELENDEMTKKK